jgi:hypothetical protein
MEQRFYLSLGGYRLIQVQPMFLLSNKPCAMDFSDFLIFPLLNIISPMVHMYLTPPVKLATDLRSQCNITLIIIFHLWPRSSFGIKQGSLFQLLIWNNLHYNWFLSQWELSQRTARKGQQPANISGSQSSESEGYSLLAPSTM